jgi:hypothetical protein
VKNNSKWEGDREGKGQGAVGRLVKLLLLRKKKSFL